MGAGRIDHAAQNARRVMLRSELIVDEITRSIEDESERRHRAEVRAQRASESPAPSQSGKPENSDGPAGIAVDLIRMVSSVRELMACTPAVSTMSGPRAAKLLPCYRFLADHTAQFSRGMEWFFETHGDRFGDERADMLATFREYVKWVPICRAALEIRVGDFGAEFERDLVADRGRQQQVADDWSAVDGDGLQ